MKELVSERCTLIVKSIITKGVLTLKDLKYICNISERTISKDLDMVDNLVRVYGLTLVRKPKLGIWIEGSDESKGKLYIAVNANNFQIPNSPKERQGYILLRLILASSHIKMQDIYDEIYISRGTFEKDLDIVENNIKKYGLLLERINNKGIKIIGDEKKLRVLIAEFFSKITYVMPVKEFIEHMYSEDMDASYKHGLESKLFSLFLDLDLKALEKIICEAEKKTGYKYSDMAFTALLIHIAIAIKRIRAKHEVNLAGIAIDTLEKTKEFEIARYMADCIEQVYNVKLSKAECAYLTIHILGSKVQYNLLNKDKEFLNSIEFHSDIESLCMEMVGKASEVLDIDFTKDIVLLKSLSMHMKTALNRLLHDMPIKNPLLEEIKNSYITSFEGAVACFEVIKNRYKINIDENEIAYIALHLEAALERIKNISIDKKRILLVCSSGIGTSQLIASKLKRIFENIEVVDIVSSLSIENYTFSNIDLVITTVPLLINFAPLIRVNPVLSQEDIENIRRFILGSRAVLVNKDSDLGEVLKLIDKDLILIKKSFSSKEEIIEHLTGLMVKMGYIREGYYNSVLEREMITSTSSGRVALPHGDMNKVVKSVVALCTLSKKVSWDEKNKVELVILIAIKKEDVLKVQSVFDIIYDIISDNKIISKIVSCDNTEKILDIILE